MSTAKDRPLLKPLIGECVVPKSEPPPTPPINISASISAQEQENGIRKTPTLNPNLLLRDGMPLPNDIKKQLTDELKYIPLEEIDPYYYNKETFVVIGNQRIYRFSKKHTLLYLSPFNALRRYSIYLMTHWLFSTFIVALVLSNSFFALKNPSTNNSLFRLSEYIFLPIYGVELTIKILGRGLILQEFTCLRTPWNIFDVFIVIFGALSLFYSSWVFQFVYAIRIFKIVPLLSDLQLRFEFVLEVIKRLRSLVVLGSILVVLFSTMGIHLFMGILTQNCVLYEDYMGENETNVSLISEQNEEESIIKTMYENDTSTLDEIMWCGNVSGSRQCPDRYTCIRGYGSNPDYGYTSFDSFPLAALQTMKLTMQDYAQYLYRNIWETGGPWHVLFFATVYLFSTFTLKTYVLAIIARAYSVKENKNEETAKNNISSEEERQQKIFDFMCKWNCSESLTSVRESVFGKISNSTITELFICVVILIDIYFMASFRYYLEDDKAIVLYYASKVCFLVYALEFIMKIISQSPWKYFQNYWNIFDFLVIFLYAVHRILTRMEIANDVLRNLLVLRMFKLCSRWPTAEFYFVTIAKTVKRYFPIFVFTVFSVYAFGLMGVYLFRMPYVVNDSLAETSWNFTSFVSSSMVSFRILSGEWFENLSVCMVLAGSSCIPYFLSSVFVLNLFVTLLSVSIIFTTYSVLNQQENDLFTRDDDENLTRISSFFKCLKTKILSKLKYRKRTNSKHLEENMENSCGGNNQHESTTRTNRSALKERTDKLRNIIKMAQQHNATNWISIIILVISSLALIFYDVHYESQSNIVHIFLYSIEICFTIYFLIYVIAEVISIGIRKLIWNASWLLDLTLVLEMILNLTLLDIHSHSATISIWSLRHLRPLMLISRIQRLKVAFTAIIQELRFLFKFIVVILFIWIYFAIQGNHLYAGFFNHCTENNQTDWGMKNNSKGTHCSASNMTLVAAHNFNDFSQSFLSVILVITRNGWIKIFNEILNADEFNEEHVPTEMRLNLFMMSLIVCGTFITLNIFFGVAIFHVKKNMMNFMTSHQIDNYSKKYDGSSVLIIEKSSFAPFNKVHEMVFTSIFDGLVMAVIIIDIVALATYSVHNSPRFLTLLSLIFSVITCFYTVELILKLMAWRLQFFKDTMNVMDLVIVIVSVLGHLLSDWSLLQGLVATAPVFRAVRLLRVLRFKPFLRRAPTISTFLLGSCRVFPVLTNLFFVLCLFFFTFALLGMSKFQYILANREQTENCYFETFTKSILTIFQVTTFTGWDEILDSCYEDNVNYPLTKVLSFLFAYIFIVFIIIVNMHCIFVVEVLKCLDVVKEATTNVINTNSVHDSSNAIHETINLNPSRSVSARRKSVACFVMEQETDSMRNAQVIIIPSDIVQVVFK